MTNETEKKENTIAENLKAIGQEVIGEIEIVGGILTADPVTRAEGEFNVEAGALRQETSESLDEAAERRQTDADKSE